MIIQSIYCSLLRTISIEYHFENPKREVFSIGRLVARGFQGEERLVRSDLLVLLSAEFSMPRLWVKGSIVLSKYDFVFLYYFGDNLASESRREVSRGFSEAGLELRIDCVRFPQRRCSSRNSVITLDWWRLSQLISEDFG